MICALDIGNSAAKGGLFESDELSATFREPLEIGESAVAERLVRRIHESGASRVGFSSVVPAVSGAVSELLARSGKVGLFRVGPDVRLPFELAYETPATLGVDRIAAAAGACAGRASDETGVPPLVVVDAGTATTVDVVDEGRFLGGPILPGPELLRRAMDSGTAQLPDVELTWPGRAISRTTAEAVGAGIMLGFVDAVRGLLLRVVDELGRQPTVVVTGGWSELLMEKIALVGRRDPHLVLRGVNYLMSLNPA